MLPVNLCGIRGTENGRADGFSHTSRTFSLAVFGHSDTKFIENVMSFKTRAENRRA